MEQITMRRMKFNHGVETPRSVWYVVLETELTSLDNRKAITYYRLKRIHAAHVIYRKTTRVAEFTLENPIELWNLISSRCGRKMRSWLFIGEPYFELDLLGFWKLIDEGRITFRPANDTKDNNEQPKRFRGTICLNSSPFFAHCKIDQKSITIVSVDNYGEKITSLYPIATRALPSEVKKNSETIQNSNRFKKCLAANANYFNTLFSVWRERQIGCWQTTASKLAMRAYQHHLTKLNQKLWNEETDKEHPTSKQKLTKIHPRLKVITFHDNIELKKFERQAYFGGEAQLFYVGQWNKPCYYVDVKSFYPWIASQYELPYCLERYENNVTLGWLANQLDFYEAIAEVLIAGPNTEYPVKVPLEKIRRRESGVQTNEEHCVIYPEGRYWTTLTSLELRDAIEKGFVKDVGRVALYKKDFVLRDFMLEWLKIREEAEENNNDGLVIISKIIANSLLGKFGQRSPSWKDEPNEVPPINWGEYWKVNWEEKSYVMFRSIGGFAQKYQGLVESSYSFIPLAAAVCSIGRHIMRSWRRSMPNDSILLQDTDGWIVTEEGIERMRKMPAFQSGQPGTFRLKGAYQEAEFWTPKHYRLDQDFILAGFGNARLLQGGRFFFAEITSPFDSLLNGLPIGKALRRIRQFAPDFLYPNRYKLESGFTVPLLLL
ncbi:MAG: DNA polymerase [Anoxybacillus ayderensis]|nr:DNA polymerase [Anoxybacillus ayderensis]